jgi:hypothetical protein
MSMNGHRPWVLVSDGGAGQSRSTLATVRALAIAGYSPVVTTSGAHSVAAASRHCVDSVDTPRVSDAGYADAINAELARRPYLTFLAASDAALLAMGADVAHLVDKSVVVSKAEACGLLPAPGRNFGSFDELRANADTLDFPVVAKPAYPGQTVRRLESEKDLPEVARTRGPLVVQPYITEEMTAVGGVIHKGRLLAAVHQRYLRTWPPDCGGACAAETTGADLELEEQLLRLLEGFDGVFQVQFAGSYLLDVNPRVYGSLPLAVKAGANLPGIYCDALRHRGPEHTVRGRPGVSFRWLEGEVRNLLSVARGRGLTTKEVLGLLRPRPGTAHGPESLMDPKPMLTRLVYAAKTGRRSKDASRAS